MTEEEVLVEKLIEAEKQTSIQEVKEQVETQKEITAPTPELETKEQILDQLKKEIKEEKRTGMLAFATETLISNESKPKLKEGKKFEEIKEKVAESEPVKKNKDTETWIESFDVAEDYLMAMIDKKFNVPLIEKDLQIKEPEEQEKTESEEDTQTTAEHRQATSETPQSNSDQRQPTAEDHKLQTINLELERLGPEKSYKLREKIGEGGFGSVYKIEEITTGVEKAVKIFHPEKAKKISVAKLEERIKEVNKRCDEEIVKIEHICNDEKGLYVIMQLMKETVKVFIENKSLEEKLDVFYMILDDVKSLHSKGIVHKDLKPSNILMDNYGNSCLADIDLVQIIEQKTGVELSDYLSSTTSEGQIITVAYSAPEVLKGEKIDHRADIYSLGKILYEFLTNERFENDWPAEMESRNYSPELIKIISKCIRKKPEDRYQSAEEIKKALEKLNLDELIVKRETSKLESKIENKSNEKKEDKKDEKTIKADKTYKGNFAKIVCKYSSNGWAYDLSETELLIESSYLVSKINTILLSNSAKESLSLTNSIVKLTQQNSHSTKIITLSNFIDLHPKLSEVKYYVDEMDLIFESDKAKLSLQYKGGYRDENNTEKIVSPFTTSEKAIKIKLELIDSPEENQKLHLDLEKFFSQKHSWKKDGIFFKNNRKHFDVLASERYNYETAKKLFLEGTYEQFKWPEPTHVNLKVEDLEIAIPKNIINDLKVKDGDKMISYRGEMHSLKIDDGTDHTSHGVAGKVILTRMDNNEVIWNTKIDDNDNGGIKWIVVNGNKIGYDGDNGFKKPLISSAEKSGVMISEKLVEQVFGPMEDKIYKIHQEMYKRHLAKKN